MQAKVEQLGDRLAVCIPADVAAALGLALGTPVDIGAESGRLVVSPPGKGLLTMAEMLEGVTPESYHKEVDWGPPVGNEVW